MEKEKNMEKLKERLFNTVVKTHFPRRLKIHLHLPDINFHVCSIFPGLRTDHAPIDIVGAARCWRPLSPTLP